MATDENIEQLCVETLGIARNFSNLQTRFDVEIIADVARLEIEINDADVQVSRSLLVLR